VRERERERKKHAYRLKSKVGGYRLNEPESAGNLEHFETLICNKAYSNAVEKADTKLQADARFLCDKGSVMDNELRGTTNGQV
jgi:hypothetical protein